jgi:hypothetical protein
MYTTILWGRKNSHKSAKRTGQSGYIALFALSFTGIFVIITGALVGFVITLSRAQDVREKFGVASHIAEAGLDYYTWFLLRFPGDFQDGTGMPGPYVHPYDDPQGGTIGQFSLNIIPNGTCNDTSSVTIASTGWTNEDPTLTRTVVGKYAQPTVADYAFVLDSNAWFKITQPVNGRVHSNYGIHMDGENTSLVTTPIVTWECGNNFGCFPTSTEPAIFGVSSGSAFWDFPSDTIDFTGFTTVLANSKAKALANSPTTFFPEIGGGGGNKGYHLVFQPNGNVDVWKVTGTTKNEGFNTITNAWGDDAHIINGESLQAILTPADLADCSIIFIEDDLWIEGTVSGKITVAAGHLDGGLTEANVIIADTIDYATPSGADGLTVLAEKSVILPINAPDDLSIRGIYVASSGHFARNHYVDSSKPHGVKPAFDGDITRNSFFIEGTIVSKHPVETAYYDGGGTLISGFQNFSTSWDRALSLEPPPLTPTTNSNFRFIEWRQN